MDDKTNPNHYKDKPIQTIKAIQSQLTPDEFIGYLKGSMIKYVSRAGFKHPGYDGMREDISKAHQISEFLLAHLTDLIGDRDDR